MQKPIARRARGTLPSNAMPISILSVVLAACGAPSTSSFTSEKNATEGKAGGQFGTPSASPDATGPCVKDPSFYDVPEDGCDNDGDGTIDNPKSCDDSAGNTAEDFAHTLGICDDAGTRGFGLVSATFTQGYERTAAPNADQHNVLSKFGDVLVPREGHRLGVLSTGIAKEFDGSAHEPFSPGKKMGGLFGADDDGALPPGFPKGAVGCPQSREVHDVISLKLVLKAPKNATGFRLDFNFHSSEWPEYICSEFNDGFIAYLTAKGFNGGTPDNISFDAQKNPVSVNNGFFDRCTPQTKTGCSGEREAVSTCPGGAAELAGTGFGIVASACGVLTKKASQGGATGWLSSQAAVLPEETFTLELMIWDTGDGRLDSTVLLDNFRWIGGGAVTTSTDRPQDPK